MSHKFDKIFKFLRFNLFICHLCRIHPQNFTQKPERVWCWNYHFVSLARFLYHFLVSRVHSFLEIPQVCDFSLILTFSVLRGPCVVLYFFFSFFLSANRRHSDFRNIIVFDYHILYIYILIFGLSCQSCS